MKKTKRFQRLILANKKMLIKSGFNYYTIQRWINGERNPSYDSALKLSKVLNIPIQEFPYIKLTINE
jgi:transcriptional regulator with XRE-family HTH domain